MDNRLKTVLLLGLLTGLLLGIGQLVGGIQGLTIALAFALLMNVSSYWWSHKIVLAMYRAKEADKSEYADLYDMVKEVSSRVKISIPEVYIIPNVTPNAFATGRNQEHGAIAFTTGILNLLSKDELKGVIAHEMSHIKNRDTLIQTAAATIAGVISYVAFMARWAAIFGGFGRDSDNGGGIIELIVLAIVAPLAAAIIQMAISRSREYLADERAAKSLHTGMGLASALQKIEDAVRQRPMRGANPATSPLFIINPLSARGISAMFSTHPPIKERIKRLRRIH